MFKPQPLHIKAASADLVDYNERLRRSVRAAVNRNIEDEAEQQPYLAGHGIIKGNCGHQIRRCMCPQHQKEIKIGIRCRTCELADGVKSASTTPSPIPTHIYQRLLEHEGGTQKVTTDTGGVTKGGISAKGTNLTPEQIRNLDPAGIRKQWQPYWQQSGAHYKDPRLGEIAFNIAGNAGPGVHAKLLQKSLNRLNPNAPPLVVDGVIGKGTRERINSVDPTALGSSLMDSYRDHHEGLVAKKPGKYGPYQKGWANRREAMRGLLNQPAAPVLVRPQVQRPVVNPEAPSSASVLGGVTKSGGIVV